MPVQSFSVQELVDRLLDLRHALLAALALDHVVALVAEFAAVITAVGDNVGIVVYVGETDVEVEAENFAFGAGKTVGIVAVLKSSPGNGNFVAVPAVSAAALVIGAYDGFYGPGTGTFLIIAFCSA